MVELALVCADVGESGNVFGVEIDDALAVWQLKEAIAEKLKYSGRADKVQLFLAKKDGVWLTENEVMTGVSDTSGMTELRVAGAELAFVGLSEEEVQVPVDKREVAAGNGPVHVLVKLPEQVADAASIRPEVPLPRTTALNEPERYAEECISMDDWGVDAVHEIPLIWRFMSSLGGCTNSGEIFWRMEDKQVVSLLVNGWFRESSPNNINVRANKKSILMGSPGIGKSTLLCVMAFHLVFKHKKNVLVWQGRAVCSAKMQSPECDQHI
ncbi:hypothetical protein PC123_g27662 [Phytophthora cactorum]|nr:hypothetical protein PC123_g27662 [Phytophthora cactorum]